MTGVCAWCGARFTPRQRTQRFCSRSCASRWQWKDHVPRQHTWARRAPVDSAHRRLRATLLPLAIGKPCPLCGQTMTSGAHLDHITPRAQGGQSVLSNVRIICGDCDHRRGARLGGQVVHARRRAARR